MAARSRCSPPEPASAAASRSSRRSRRFSLASASASIHSRSVAASWRSRNARSRSIGFSAGRRPAFFFGSSNRPDSSCGSSCRPSSQASPAATQCLQNRSSSPTGHEQSYAIREPRQSRRTVYVSVPRTRAPSTPFSRDISCTRPSRVYARPRAYVMSPAMSYRRSDVSRSERISSLDMGPDNGGWYSDTGKCTTWHPSPIPATVKQSKPRSASVSERRRGFWPF